MSRDWTFFLEDILEASNKVLRYTNGMTLETFQSDELVFDAVVRNLEIIGEAAKHLPAEIQEMMPEVEWSKAAAFRDVIAHGYFGLNVHIIWDVTRNKVPGISTSVEKLLTQLRNDQT